MGQYQKGKTNLDFTEARDSEWQWHQLGPVVKLLSKKWWIPVGARLERPKLEPEGSIAGVFEHSRHSVWLLWHLSSV